MVIPYSLSACSIVPLLCVITMNCVLFVSLFRYFAKRDTFPSSRAASISSNRQKGEGFRLWIANNRAIAVKDFSPPDNCIIFCNFFPGGCAIIRTPASRISSSSISSSVPLPPPKSSLNTLSNSLRISSNFSANCLRIAVSSS